MTLVGFVTVDQQSLACALNVRWFSATSSLFWRSFYLASPGEAKICLTVRLFGNHPGSIALTPILGLEWHGPSGSGWSACLGSSCGAATVSSAPSVDYLPDVPMHVVWTIEAPRGSTLGDYLLQFGLCRGGGFIGLRIGLLNQTFQNPSPVPLCPLLTYGVGVTFDGYTGLVPNLNGSIPIPLPLLS